MLRGMKAYSTDLRERIVAAVDAGMPRPKAARTFRVSVATLKRYLKQRMRQNWDIRVSDRTSTRVRSPGRGR